jgi:chemotaxis protein methyltransferase CheR
VSPALHASAPPRGLADAVGLPLNAYRLDHIKSCVIRALRRERLSDINALVAKVDRDPGTRTRFRRAIAVSTTGLFRDPTQLRWVDTALMPKLAQDAERRVKVWSAGCAAGEEAFSLAMMLEWHNIHLRSEVLGSDILEESLADGETGVVGGARIPAGMRGRVNWDLRDLTSQGPPAGDFDLILCRNLMSFLTPVAVESISRTLAAGLAPGGVLVVARDEALESPEAFGLAEIAPSAYRRV